MKNTLFINACPRPQSRTLTLAQEVLKKVSGTVTEINLYQEPLRPLDWEQLKERDALIASHTMSQQTTSSLPPPIGTWPFLLSCAYTLSRLPY